MEQIMDYLHNYFYKFKEQGTFTINFNSITRGGQDLKGKYVPGQYVKIVGSAVNDGVYKVIATIDDDMEGITLEGCLSDETFTGYICSLGVPKSFVELSKAIQDYNKAHSNDTGIVSESFGGYSYTKATINGRVTTWYDVFSNQLKPFRRMTDGFQWVKEIK